MTTSMPLPPSGASGTAATSAKNYEDRHADDRRRPVAPAPATSRRAAAGRAAAAARGRGKRVASCADSDEAPCRHQLTRSAAPPTTSRIQKSGSDAGPLSMRAPGTSPCVPVSPVFCWRRFGSDSSRKLTPSSNSVASPSRSSRRPPGDGARNSTVRPAGSVRSTGPQPNPQRRGRFATELHSHPLADPVVPPLRPRQRLPAHLDEVRNQDRPVWRPHQVGAFEIEVEEQGRIGCRAGRRHADEHLVSRRDEWTRARRRERHYARPDDPGKRDTAEERMALLDHEGPDQVGRRALREPRRRRGPEADTPHAGGRLGIELGARRRTRGVPIRRPSRLTPPRAP